MPKRMKSAPWSYFDNLVRERAISNGEGAHAGAATVCCYFVGTVTPCPYLRGHGSAVPLPSWARQRRAPTRLWVAR
mgnify:CR=1 FL=1